MAVLFNRQLTFLFLFFLPQLSFSYCPTTIPCGDPNIEISYPFFLPLTTSKDDPDCIGIYPIYCNGYIPTIQLEDIKFSIVNYTVKNISYEGDKIITIQPPKDYAINLYGNSSCSFLYNFTNPIPHFELPRPRLRIVELFDQSRMSSCKFGKHDFPLLRDDYNYSACKDFNFYYSDKSKEELSSPCRAPEPPLIEFRLSFAKVDDDDDGLCLLFAGFSNSLKLDPDCFEENVCSSQFEIMIHRRNEFMDIEDQLGLHMGHSFYMQSSTDTRRFS